VICPACGSPCRICGQARIVRVRSLASMDVFLTETIEREKAVYVPTAVVKREVALDWLARPVGFLRRIAWAWRLVFRT
jgi:hypothetical protein